MKKTVYELDLFEAVIISKKNNVDEIIKKVPGGWMYIIDNGDAIMEFIPFSALEPSYCDSPDKITKYKISKEWSSKKYTESDKIEI